ncbi:MAG: SEC-C domain-containing protein [Thermoanaerobaculia bacterium]|nr:SEC-C domain-containing protein [Thermoanaerobaculia bacterium]
MNTLIRTNQTSFSQTSKAEAPSCSCCPPPKPTVRATPKIGRNEPCPCGSDRKYKKCCGR